MFTNPFFVLCVFIKGISAAIKQEQDYNGVLKSLSSSHSSTLNINIRPNPEILLIQQTTPFTYKEAEEIYNLSKKYNIPVDTFTTFSISSGLGIGAIERAIEEKVNKK
jgi:hypothetical protein